MWQWYSGYTFSLCMLEISQVFKGEILSCVEFALNYSGGSGRKIDETVKTLIITEAGGWVHTALHTILFILGYAYKVPQKIFKTKK